jgi:hypothetical protein
VDGGMIDGWMDGRKIVLRIDYSMLTIKFILEYIFASDIKEGLNLSDTITK